MIVENIIITAMWLVVPALACCAFDFYLDVKANAKRKSKEHRKELERKWRKIISAEKELDK